MCVQKVSPSKSDLSIIFPLLWVDLMSCSRLDEKEATKRIAKEHCELYHRADLNRSLMTAKRRKLCDLFEGHIQSPRKVMSASVRTVLGLWALGNVSPGSLRIWNRRMALAPAYIVGRRMKSGGFGTTTKKSDANCDVCVETNRSKSAETGKLVENSEDLALYTVICKHFPVRSLVQNLYIITMTTNAYRYFRLQMLNTTDYLPQLCYDHIAWIDRIGKETVRGGHRVIKKKFLGMRKVLESMGTKLTTTSALQPRV